MDYDGGSVVISSTLHSVLDELSIAKQKVASKGFVSTVLAEVDANTSADLEAGFSFGPYCARPLQSHTQSQRACFASFLHTAGMKAHNTFPRD